MKRHMLLWTALLCLVLPLAGQAADFQQVAREVNADLAQARQERQATQEELMAELAALERELAAAKAELGREQSRLVAGQNQLADLSQEQTRLESNLEGRQAEMDELAGLVRAGARDMLALAERSPVTGEHPGRLEALRSYQDQERFPGLDDIKQLVRIYFQEMTATAGVSLRQGEFVDQAGVKTSGELLRLGGFNTIYRNGDVTGYAQIGPGTGRLLAVGGALPWQVESSLEAYLSDESPAVYMDISNGGALSRLSRQPSWWEQIMAGGPLIWPIMAVGLAALILIVERLFYLGRVHANTDRLMDAVNRQVADGDIEGAWTAIKSQEGRPTANVLKAGLSLKGFPPEALKSGLTEAMLKEMPRLERFLSTLKVLAAVAPLLGLLGTVSGMINTFHVITAHGTGDPRLMASGISEALITTELGLAVAIPILMFSSMLGRRAQHVVSDMEEKAVALTAALVKSERP